MTLLRGRLGTAGLLFLLELAALAFAYQIAVDLECSAIQSTGFCSFLGSFFARAAAVAATFLLVLWARPAATRDLVLAIEADGGRRTWLWLHLAGVAVLFAPLAAGGDLGAAFSLAVGPWLAGGATAAAGAVLWLAPASAWHAWLRTLGPLPVAALAGAFLLPDIADLAQPLWDLSWPARATFVAVYLVLRAVGADAMAWPDDHVIELGDFHVEVASACSGIEGLALVLGLSTLYALLFRAQLRQRRFWLVVVPIGLAASWTLNVLRIAALVAIGAKLSPEFALNGFHSYAGWMLFTLLAVSLLYAAHSIAWLHRDGVGPSVAWRSDWNAACILPFVALMAADVAIATAFPQPVLAYPLKIVAAAAVLAAFRADYRRLATAPDAVALVSGALVGLAWIVSQPPAGESDLAATAAVAALGGAAFAAWAAARIAGTVLVVPLVEELFFRGYLLARIDRGGPALRVLAIVVSSALFAAMHDRWLVAFLAGVVFALLHLRRGRLADAIAAHVAANLVVALWALASGDWSAI